MILDIETWDRDLKISYFGLEGDIKIKQFYLDKCENWRICSPSDPQKSNKFTNWDGKPVKRVKAKRLNKFSILEFVRNLNEEDKIEICGNNFPKIQSVDIETEVTDSFPNPDIAKERITTIAISFESKKTVVFGWKPITKEQEEWIFNENHEYLKKFGDWEFKYVCFENERDMMFSFINKVLSKCSLVTGWNFMGFDWKYIKNRCGRLGIDVVDASPSKKLQGKNDIPMHLGMLDYMEIYKKWDRTVQIKESNKLDFVAGEVLGVTKLKYDGTLQELYENDYEKYVLYNAIDAALVSLIHTKLKIANAPFAVANFSNLSIYKASSPVALTEALLWNGYYSRNMVIANDRLEIPRGDYEGAYVKEPEKGFFKAATCYDFASLYPSIMRQYNISPESFIKKEKDQEQYEAYQKDPSKIACVTGTIYDNSSVSVMKEIMTNLYGKRKVHKKLYLDIEKCLSKRTK